jgi:hypothetical protein
MRKLFDKVGGPALSYQAFNGYGIFYIHYADQFRMSWSMPRWELFVLGLKAIRTAVFS